jgi:hypothetical protein
VQKNIVISPKNSEQVCEVWYQESTMNENKSEYIYELDTNDIIKINNDNAEENNNMSI